MLMLCTDLTAFPRASQSLIAYDIPQKCVTKYDSQSKQFLASHCTIVLANKGTRVTNMHALVLP